MTGFYNEIIPSDLYREQMGTIDLQRSIFNCSSCPLVTSSSEVLDIPLSSSPFYFIFEDFFIPGFHSDEYQSLSPLMDWLNIKDEDVVFTPSYKCNKGESTNCSHHIVSELILLQPKLTVYFGKQPPKFLSNKILPGQYEQIENQLILYTHSIKQWSDPSIYQEVCQHLWQAHQFIQQQEVHSAHAYV